MRHFIAVAVLAAAPFFGLSPASATPSYICWYPNPTGCGIPPHLCIKGPCTDSTTAALPASRPASVRTCNIDSEPITQCVPPICLRVCTQSQPAGIIGNGCPPPGDYPCDPTPWGPHLCVGHTCVQSASAAVQRPVAASATPSNVCHPIGDGVPCGPGLCFSLIACTDAQPAAWEPLAAIKQQLDNLLWIIRHPCPYCAQP